MNSHIDSNWLDDFTLLIKLPSKDIVDKVIRDWIEEGTSEDSAGPSFRKKYLVDMNEIDPPTDFMCRQIVLKELKISRFSHYEDICFVNKYNVKNCFPVCYTSNYLDVIFIHSFRFF